MDNSFNTEQKRQGKLFHAYIVSGSDERARMEMCASIAARAVCASGKDKACGICRDCKKAAAGIHPDIIYLSRREDKREYLTADIREMRSSAYVLPNEAQRKVYVVTGADRLTDQCQNILLKTLEEPPEYSVFILETENSGTLLETVRSRCVEVSPRPRRSEENEDTEEMKNARSLVGVLENDNKLETARALFALEGMQKAELSDLCKCVRHACAERARTASAGSRQRLLEIADAFSGVSDALELNVNSGHAVGLLLSRLV